jgi:hypothetical protein
MEQNSLWILIIVVIVLILFYIDSHTCKCISKPEFNTDFNNEKFDNYDNVNSDNVVSDNGYYLLEPNKLNTIPMDSRASPQYVGLDDYSIVLDANDSQIPYAGIDPSIKNEWIFNGLYSNLNDKDYYKTVQAFNDYEKKLSYIQANNPYLLRNMFNNPYLDLATKESRLQQTCIPFDNINQCISKCVDEEECVGFYIQKDSSGNDINQCCFLNQPIQNDFNQRSVYYFDSYDPAGNTTYSSKMNLRDCMDKCPECKLNNCPRGYRCANLRYDAQNANCLITNNTRLRDVAVTGDGKIVSDEGFNNLGPSADQYSNVNVNNTCMTDINMNSLSDTNANPKCLAKLANWQNLMQVNAVNNSNLVINTDTNAVNNPDLQGTNSIYNDYVNYNNQMYSQFE